jgi:murein peptide amidase A
VQQAPLPAVLRGRSLRGRPIIATHLGDGSAPRILVVGAIHGDETAGIAIVDALLAGPVVPGNDIWVVPNLNPDGTALDRRQNAQGIDLNRNFPYGWRAGSPDGPINYPGPRAASEPETQFAIRLIRTIRPAITIWFHQQERVVDLSGGSPAIERRFGALVGLPVRRLERYPGSVSSWENHTFPGTTSFVVELPAGALSAPAVARYVRAIVALASD